MENKHTTGALGTLPVTPGRVFTLLHHLCLASPCEAGGDESNHDWSSGSVREGSVCPRPITTQLGAHGGDR